MMLPLINNLAVSPSQPLDNSFPILAISLLGILTTAFLLLMYYIFVIKCCHCSDVIGWLSGNRRVYRHEDPIASYSIDNNNRGLEESCIRTLPTFRFRIGVGGDGEGNGSFHECVVCLNEFQEEERIRLLPNCFHVFHIDCIDAWLQTNTNCPLCRSDITATSSVAAARFIEQAIHHNFHRREDTVIDVRHGGSQSDISMRKAEEQRPGCEKGRRLHHAGSMGDECIDVRWRDEQFSTHPTRKSFSMDFSQDRKLSLAVDEILHQNPRFKEAGSGESSSGGSSVASEVIPLIRILQEPRDSDPVRAVIEEKNTIFFIN